MKGMMFTDKMYDAAVCGRKTVTRRIMNPQPPEGTEFVIGYTAAEPLRLRSVLW